MTNITKHDSIQEGEGDYSEYCWIGLLVCRDSIGVDNFLEHFGELVDFKVTWRLYSMIRYKLEGGYFNILVLLLHSFDEFESVYLLTLWYPTKTHEQLVSFLELVQ